MIMKGTFLILGTNHFDTTNNQDLFSVDTDVMSEVRQKEMAELVTCLERFKPTKIALEFPKDMQPSLTKSYTDYLKGGTELSRNERQQIGFRLGKMAGLYNLHAVDWNEDVKGVPDLDEWIDEHPSGVVDDIMEKGKELTSKMESDFKSHSIREFLLKLNDPEHVERDQQMYMKMALIGNADHHVGAAWTAMYWYYRNMIIYKHLLDLVEHPNERIFVLYGAGHLHLLKQFIQENGDYQLKDPEDYLK